MKTTNRNTRSLLTGGLAAVLGLTTGVVDAQTMGQPSATAGTSEPSPYYLGVSQGLTYDTNVFRTPSGPSDTYSTTSLLGGFDQRIGRQRIFGTGTVGESRYFDQSQLNNTSYNVNGGLDWETVGNVSGNISAALGRSLASPVTPAFVPIEQRNLSNTASIDARARVGGPGLLTLEGAVGYSRVNFSAPLFVTSQSRQSTASLGLYYRPGGPLRLGVAGRVTRTYTPKAFFEQTSGTFQPNTVKGKNIDFLTDYELSGLLSFSGRLSYTKQDSTNAVGSTGADFSGLTGSLSAVYRATGKLTFNLYATRDAGLNSSLFNGYTLVQTGTTTILTPATGLYENNQVTTTLALGAAYLATGKITANAGVRYGRAKLLNTLAGQTFGTTTDAVTTLYLGANYEIRRNWSAMCNISHDKRDVSGLQNYSVDGTTIGCSTQYLWR